MDMDTVVRRQRFRAYPAPVQEQSMARLFGCVRTAYNDALRMREEASRTGRKAPSHNELSRALTEAKATPERAWMNEVSAVPLQQAVRDLNTAYGNYFSSLRGTRRGRKIRKPVPKKRGSRQSARFTANTKFKLRTCGKNNSRQGRIRWGQVFLQKIGWVKFRLSRQLPAGASSVTLVRESNGRYYLSFVMRTPLEAASRPTHPDRVAGVDLGLVDFAAIACSDGSREKIGNPRFLKKQLRKLRTAQKELARRQKGSANREKSRRKVARIHAKVVVQRLDHCHKLGTRLVRENQAVAVETLNIKGMERTRLSRSVQDAGWGIFLRLLAAKAAAAGRIHTAVGQFEPTSQVCSVCGAREGKKPLDVRRWQCRDCGTVLDRDWNAAVNIMAAAGHAETLNACGGTVRRRLAGAEPEETGTISIPAVQAAAMGIPDR
jgi:putative transposase